MKACPHCETTKPESEFHLNRTTKDGLAKQCKDCCRVNRSAWYVRNRPRAIEASTGWIKANRGRRNATARKNSSKPENMLAHREKVARHQRLFAKWYLRSLNRGGVDLNLVKLRVTLARSRRTFKILRVLHGS